MANNKKTDVLSPAYHGGAFFEEIGVDFKTLDKKNNIINADVLDAWFPPSKKILEKINNYLPWLMRTSPPTQCEGMIKAIATARNIDQSNILPGAGSSDLIYRCFSHWLNCDSKVLIFDPSYGEYIHVLEKVIGCQVDKITLQESDNYAINLSGLKEYFNKNYDLIIIVNPNNPTGIHIQREQLEYILRQVTEETKVWVDEAYIEYAGENQSLEKFAASSKNIIVCKSMSKVYALSGNRVAYLCAAPLIINPLRSLTPPWAVSLLGQVAATMALEDAEYYQQKYLETHQLRSNLAKELRSKTNLRVHEGVANYLLCKLPEEAEDASVISERCRKHGLFIRDISLTAPCLGPKTFRIAVKDAATNKKMLRILCEVL
jgi:histidinol-phosphate/aromatic aminotransferase/cobyric acid decarboxylase-like protein